MKAFSTDLIQFDLQIQKQVTILPKPENFNYEEWLDRLDVTLKQQIAIFKQKRTYE